MVTDLTTWSMPARWRVARIVAAAGIVVMMIWAPACSRDPAPGSAAAAAEGERLMRQMSDTLAKTPAFQFETDESLEQPGPPSSRLVWRFTRRATVRRPDGLYFELRGTAGSSARVAAYFDGQAVSLRDDADGVWAQTSAPGTLDAMLDDVARRYSLPVPIADVVYSVPYEAFVGRSTKGGFDGRETLDGVACARLAYTDEFLEVRVWIPSAGQRLPRRVELVYKRAEGAPKARIDFTSWNLAPAIADGAFSFSPVAGTTQVAFERLVGGLLSGGHAAAATPATVSR